MNITRRRALQISAVAATLPAALFAADDPAQLPIIDCHQHLWDLEKQDIPWLENGNSPLRRNYVMSDYLEAIAGTGITKAVYMEVDVAAGEKIKEGETLTEICKAGKSPTVAAVIGCIPDDPGFGEYVRHWKGNSYVKGMRVVMQGKGKGQEARCLSKAFVKGIQQLGEAGLSFDLCMASQDLSDGDQLVAACPETRFIVDHVGNADPYWWSHGRPNAEADQWQRDITSLASRKNTICKISGIVARVKPEWSAADIAPAINFCLDSFGPKRVVFGSDWPVCLKGATLAQWVKALREIIAERPLEEQKQLLWANAVREYTLPL